MPSVLCIAWKKTVYEGVWIHRCVSACVHCMCVRVYDTGEALRVLFDSLICKYVFIRFLIMYYTIM